MRAHTHNIMRMLLSEDDTLSSEERFWFGELLEGRLPHREGPPQGPLLTINEARKQVGVSYGTFRKMLEELPVTLPAEYQVQVLTAGVQRIPPALVWWFRTQRGRRYEVMVGRGPGNKKAA